MLRIRDKHSGSRIPDPGWTSHSQIQDPGSGINIPDPGFRIPFFPSRIPGPGLARPWSGSKNFSIFQGCGSGSELDPYSIGSVDPNPYSESGSGSRRRAKMTHKSRKKLRNFMLWSAGCSLLRVGDFFCNLDVLYEGLGIGKLLFLIKSFCYFFSAINFWSSKPLDPEPDRYSA